MDMIEKLAGGVRGDGLWLRGALCGVGREFSVSRGCGVGRGFGAGREFSAGRGFGAVRGCGVG